MSKELLFSFTKKDFTLDWFSGEGGGGQHRNRHKNCVRITHKETGLVGMCQEHKSAKANKKVAFHRLVKKLVEHYLPKPVKTRVMTEKHTRTYHEPDDRVVDHLTGEKFSYRQTVGRGDLSEVIESRAKKLIMEIDDD